MGLCASSRRNNVIDIKRKIPDDEEKKLTSQVLISEENI